MGNMLPTKPRAKLFERAQEPRGMELTPRDLSLLAHVARHRFLTSAQLALLDGGSPQGVLRCLRVLYDHGLLDRPKSQLATLHDSGPRPFVYGLGQKGARALREYGTQSTLGWIGQKKINVPGRFSFRTRWPWRIHAPR